MVTKIIDLTNNDDSSSSFPPPPMSSQAPIILNSGHADYTMTFRPNFNPNLFYTNHQQNTQSPAAVSGFNYHPSHPPLFPPPPPHHHHHHNHHHPVVPNFHPNMYGGQVANNVLNPIPYSSGFLYPNGIQLNDEPWTQREHELFMMGLMKYGDGSWIEISKHFLWNKTPMQVQSYAVVFFKHRSNIFQSSTIGRWNQTFPPASNSMMARSNNNMPMMIANEAHVQQTLMLFPEKPHFSPSGEAINNEATTSYGYGYASKSVTNAGTNAYASSRRIRQEVDLELRLGYY